MPWIEISEHTDCPTCNGSGVVLSSVDYIRKNCPKCGGSGEILNTTPISLRALKLMLEDIQD